jgi:hypothetical protein
VKRIEWCAAEKERGMLMNLILWSWALIAAVVCIGLWGYLQIQFGSIEMHDGVDERVRIQLKIMWCTVKIM